MLKKLYKHELISIYRVLLPLYAVIFGLSGVQRLLGAFESDNTFVGIAQAISMTLTVITAVGLMFASIVLIVISFYRSLLGKQGYLTFSLPFKAISHIICKLVCGVIAGVTTVIAELAALCIIIPDSDFILSFFEEIKMLLYFGNDTAAVFKTVIVCIEIAIIVFLYFSTTYLMFFTAISIGQRFKNKILGSIIAYVVIYSAVETVMMSVIFILAALDMADILSFITLDATFISYQKVMGFIFGVYIVQAVPYFAVTNHFLSNKLNLE